ncbi:MAG: response regulator transcription factor [Clostridia bacterium]|nr:response regulator transcription factor [Clostridia bacterium]
MEKLHVLIIEDDKEINGLLSAILVQNGYMTNSAYTGFEGLSMAKRDSYDLILLDLMLPYKSGDEILREIRENSDVPVIVISAKDTTRIKVDLLRLGADDYITKPFDVDEVVARVESALRRSGRQKDQPRILSFKEISLNSESKSVTVCGKQLLLTAKEFCILELLMMNPKMVYSKENLFENVWQEMYAYDDKTINTHVCNLRNKLKMANPEGDYIETVWGIGYKLQE